jgi:TatA/E family protein of Tat protein translocase
MFNISLPELLLIFIVALLVFGPKQLPHLAKNLGRLIAKLSHTSQGFLNKLQQPDKKTNDNNKSKNE